MRRAMVLGDMIRVKSRAITGLSDAQAIRILLADIATTIVKMVEYTDL
jgi:hypothetical protein